MPSPTNKKQVQSFIGMINYLSKFSPRLSELAEPIRELSKDKVPFNWRPEYQQAFTQVKERNFKCCGVSLLQPQEPNHVADRCKYERSWCLFTPRRKACIFCKYSSYRSPERICGHRDRIACSGLENGEIPLLFICQSFHLRNWPETAWSYISEEFKPSNSKITVDTYQDFCLPFYSKIYSWYYKQACRLFVMARWSKSYLTYIYIRLPVNWMLEVIVNKI